MITGLHSVSLFTENAPRLAAFYRDVLGLVSSYEGNCPIGDSAEKAFDFALPDGRTLYVVDHSDVAGPNPGPERVMVNFASNSLDATVAELTAQGVPQIGSVYEIEGLGRTATFADVDGNFVQLIEPSSVPPAS